MLHIKVFVHCAKMLACSMNLYDLYVLFFLKYSFTHLISAKMTAKDIVMPTYPEASELMV